MSFLRSIQWYHSLADPIWPDGTFKGICFIHCYRRILMCWIITLSLYPAVMLAATSLILETGRALISTDPTAVSASRLFRAFSAALWSKESSSETIFFIFLVRARGCLNGLLVFISISNFTCFSGNYRRSCLLFDYRTQLLHTLT